MSQEKTAILEHVLHALAEVGQGHVGANLLNRQAARGSNLERYLAYQGLQHALAGKKVNPEAMASYKAILGPELAFNYDFAHNATTKALEGLKGQELPHEEQLAALREHFNKLRDASTGGSVIDNKLKKIEMYGPLASAIEDTASGRKVELQGNSRMGGVVSAAHRGSLKKIMEDERFHDLPTDTRGQKILKNLRGATPAAAALGGSLAAGAYGMPFHMGWNMMRDRMTSSPALQRLSGDMYNKGIRGQAGALPARAGESFGDKILRRTADIGLAKLPEATGTKGKIYKKLQQAKDVAFDAVVSPALRTPYEIGHGFRDAGITEDHLKSIGALKGKAEQVAASPDAQQIGKSIKERLGIRRPVQEAQAAMPAAPTEHDNALGSTVLGLGGLGAASMMGGRPVAQRPAQY